MAEKVFIFISIVVLEFIKNMCSTDFIYFEVINVLQIQNSQNYFLIVKALDMKFNMITV